MWTVEELEEVLGGEDATFLASILGYDQAPFFEGSHYVLHLPEPLAEQAQRRRLDREQLLGQIQPLLSRLLAARDERDRPPTDDKVLADWNGMAITGLATAGRVLGESSMVERAARCADFILEYLRPEGGPLLHSWRAGQAKNPAYLSDYAFLVRGLLALHEATAEPRWLKLAAALSDEQSERLGDPRGGFFVAGEQPDVLFRSREVFDGALPSANAVAALNLLALGERTGETHWIEAAAKLLAAFSAILEKQPEGARTLTVAAREYQAKHGGASGAGGEPAADPEPAALDSEAASVVSAKASVAEPDADGWRAFTLRLEIAFGWHLYAHQPGDDQLVATELSALGGELRAVAYPPGESLGEVEVYAGQIDLTGEIRSEDGEPRWVLKYQPCDDTRCLAPVELELG